jgi:hypothetical protein
VSRLPVRKTYKLFIGGEFPRSESGRTYEAEGQNVARGSRKDIRDAVRAARGAFPKWAAMTAYNRGQVLYRIAEMIEARRSEFADLCSGPKEVERSIDRFVWYAGWADKLAQVLGSSNPVAGPYFNFTVPEPQGVGRDPGAGGAGARRARLADRSGARRRQRRRRGCLRDASAGGDRAGRGTCDGRRAGRRCQHRHRACTRSSRRGSRGHMDVNTIDVTGANGDVAELERLAAENVKRVVRGAADDQSAWEISPFLELKTVWHPIGV